MDNAETEKSEEARESQATAIVRLAMESRVELWHTPAGDGYITILVDGHREHHPLNSRGAKDYLARLPYVDTGKAPNPTALQAAIATLSGTCRFDGEEHDVHVRVAHGDDGAIYLDLVDRAWRVIEVTSSGWRIITNPPVKFRRTRGMLPLPAPVQGGSIDELRPFINVASDADFCLMVSWQIQALKPTGPYPILVLIAEQGAAKTTVVRVLRRLCDPNKSDARRPPRNTEDLMISATNAHVVAFDNLSRLSEDLSDSLAVLATGGGFSVRRLYENGEEHIFNAQRPIILNGISQVATRGDLLDRAVAMTLPPIPDAKRKDETTFWCEFEEAQPRILGALLDAVACGLRCLDDVHIENKPRMADFALWAVAAEAACPWPEGMFLDAYMRNRQGAVEATLDGDPVADVVRAIATTPPWTGTATELLAELNVRIPDHITKQKGWFTRGRQVSDAPRRLAPALRRVGVDVDFTRQAHTGRRTITLQMKKRGSSASPSSPASPGPVLQAQTGDAQGDDGDDASPCASPENPSVYGVGDAGDEGDAQKHNFPARPPEEDDEWTAA
jgi:hypothetical protein